jgi:hypothetical protein
MALALQLDGVRNPTFPLATFSNVAGSIALFPVQPQLIPLFLVHNANASA